MGSERKHRPQARRAFCHRLRAAIARLKVTGMGRSPRWNLQKGTFPAWIGWHKGNANFIFADQSLLWHVLWCPQVSCFRFRDCVHLLFFDNWWHLLEVRNECMSYSACHEDFVSEGERVFALTSLKASLNSPPGAMPSCSVMWAETLSSSICMRPDITPFWHKKWRKREKSKTENINEVTFVACR